MPTANLERGLGRGSHKLHAAVATDVSDGGTYDTGLSSVDAASVTTTTAGEIATITSISGGTLTIAIKDNDDSAGTQADVHVVAVGEA